MKKTPARSRVEMTEIVMPGQTNTLGRLFGGVALSWMDIAGSVAAIRHAGGPAVTASIDRVDFFEPVRLGDIVIMQAQVNYAGHTSLEVGVRVETEDPRSGSRRYATKAYFTFVAVDDQGRPRPVSPLELESDEDRRRHEAALARRHARRGLRQNT